MEFAFIGVGRMGGPLARNLIRANKRVRVYNRSVEGREATLAAGKTGIALENMQDLACCDVVFTCLALPEHIEQMMLGETGAYSHMKKGAVHVELSTIAPANARFLATQASKYGLDYVQCSLGKSPADAEKGCAPLFVGGDQVAIERLAEVWPILGKFHNLGTLDAACAFKLVSNLIGMTNIAVLGQGIAIAKAAGIDGETLLQLLADTGAQSFQLRARGASMVADSYVPPRFLLDLAIKDVRLGCEMAQELGVNSGLMEQSLNLFRQASAKGYGEMDCAAVAKMFD